MAVSTVSHRELRTEYDRYGYCIVERVIPDALIDDFLVEYERAILPSREWFYRQTNEFERNRVDRYGHVCNSFLQIHSFDQPIGEAHFTHRVARAARAILTHPSIRQMLTEITGDPAHKLIQSMFFDKNMATEPHQDNYYLDSFPPGRLLGCWFALEDIHVDAGRFFVIPGSHRHRFELTRDEVRVNELYLRKVARYVRENRSRIFAPGLRKGDVLFWNAMTIHGSLKTADRRFSRRSLTAHYMPPAALFGRLHIRLPIENESMVHDGMSLWRYSLADVEQPPLVHRLATRAYRRIFTFSAQPELYRLGKPFAGIAKRIRMRLRDPRRE